MRKFYICVPRGGFSRKVIPVPARQNIPTYLEHLETVDAQALHDRYLTGGAGLPVNTLIYREYLYKVLRFIVIRKNARRKWHISDITEGNQK